MFHKKVGPDHSAVLTFIGYKQTDRQTDRQTNRQAKFLVYIYSTLILTKILFNKLNGILYNLYSAHVNNYGLYLFIFKLKTLFLCSDDIKYLEEVFINKPY